MAKLDDPFETIDVAIDANDLGRGTPGAVRSLPTIEPAATIARLAGFDVDDRPLVSGLPGAPHQMVVGRSVLPLSRSDVGGSVVVLFECGDVTRPIVMGVLQEHRVAEVERTHQTISVRADEDRLVVSAEREIVLKCGDASITLTRAGKVIIKGKYILSRSSGYNKIKGAAVDIN